jgi:hypothetical protein
MDSSFDIGSLQSDLQKTWRHASSKTHPISWSGLGLGFDFTPLNCAILQIGTVTLNSLTVMYP